MSFQISPLRGLFFKPDLAGNDVAAPPYDIISPPEHQSLLDRSPYNIVRLTLGDRPGERSDYRQRAGVLETWRREKILREDPRPALHVYGVDYQVPGHDQRLVFLGLLALGSLHDFSERVVLPHEGTFSDIVDDRYRLLEATGTHLEQIIVLYADPERKIDEILLEASRGEPRYRVEARSGEIHSLWSIEDGPTIERLRSLFASQRPIIADGHHRYTTACLFREKHRGDSSVPGAGWLPMVLGNLFGEGLSILATHRLISLGGRTGEAMDVLRERLEPTTGEGPWDFQVETRDGTSYFSIPAVLRSSTGGVAATGYAILHEFVLGNWLKPYLGSAPVQYFKEGTGEEEALREGRGDLLFRMRPVGREEFLRVVEGGEVFPHKTTFFYPKLWSGMALWSMAEPR